MSLRYHPRPTIEQQYARLDQRLTADAFPDFQGQFDKRFGGVPIDMAVRNGHWRHAYSGQHKGVQMMHDLVFVDTGEADHDSDFIMLLGSCRYHFSKDGALYVMSWWKGIDLNGMKPVQKTRQHLIVKS